MRRPKVNDLSPFSALLVAAGSVMRRTAVITMRYVLALMKKMKCVSTPTFMSNAARMGPSTREPFTEADDKLMDPPRSCGFTKLGRTAENAGALNEFPIPTVNWARKRMSKDPSKDVKIPNRMEPTIWMLWAKTSHFLRSNLSAITPAGMDNNSNGPSWAKTKSATMEALSVRA